MLDRAGKRGNLSPIVPLFIGGAIAGGIAMVFAPQLSKARDAVCAAGRRTRDLMKHRGEAGPSKVPEEDIYCAVPESADVCYDLNERT